MGRARKHPRGTMMGGERDVVASSGATRNNIMSRLLNLLDQIHKLTVSPKDNKKDLLYPPQLHLMALLPLTHHPKQANTTLPLEARKVVLTNLNLIWKDWKKDLKALHYTPHKDNPEYLAMIKSIVGIVDQSDMFLTTRTGGGKMKTDPKTTEICDELRQKLNEVLENERTKKFRKELLDSAVGTDGHGRVRCMGKGVTPTQFSGHSSTPDKDVIREELRGELHEELRVEMQVEVAQSESKMGKQIEFLLSFLPLTARESFRTTFGDSSGVGSVNASGSQVHARENIDSFSEEVRRLAFVPMPHGGSYNARIVNNFRFRTKSRDERKATQNSGVILRASMNSYASAKDKNSLLGQVPYYGILTDIIEIQYAYNMKFILFKCDWVDNDKGRNNLPNDEPFILSNQAEQVWYVSDLMDTEWNVAVTMARRDGFDVYSCMYETDPYGNQVFDNRIPLNDDVANWVQDGVEGTLVDVNDSEYYDEDEDCDEVD
ncbi:hypothetical protein BUALT_Bualt04G0035400 [Buddleja alternifolia]|uniref:DUF4216 domain-containing protein n=1 Tax=Buddleja alternifolia TaxID=168488 RepID=A0AAV6XTK6_9LAMI|nr:hypothetical protein BUALT_Bualt04G0035400 [Buddleja alternifolia]